MQLIIQWQKLINTDKLSLWFITTTAKVYEHREIKFVIIHLIIQRQKLINTNKLSLWLYNGDYAIDCKTAKGYQHWQTDYTTAKVYEHRPNQVCNYTIEYTTGKGYQHWQTAIVIVQRQKSTNTENWVCHYKTAKVYQHWQTEFFYYITAKVYEHRETKFGNIQRKTLPTLTNQVCDYITAKIYQYWPGADPGFSDGGFGQTSAYIILLLLNKPFFHNKK